MQKDRSNIAVAWVSRARLRLRAWLAIGCLLAVAASAGAGTLTNVSPTGASTGISVTVHGTGFHTTPANHQIQLTPASGAPVTITPTAGAVVDAGRGVRSLTFRLPAGVPAGAAAIRVTNLITDEVSEGRTIQIVDVTLPDVVSAPRGTTGLVVRIVGSPNAEFSTINTRVTFGAGVTVTATTVDSPTVLRATIDIAPTATLGTRTLAITTPTQLLTLAKAFLVTDTGGTPNQAPVARPGGPYTGAVGQAVTVNGSASSDPDPGDTLTYAWNFGDGTAEGAGVTTQHTYAQAGSFPLTLTVTDSRGATHAASTTVTISATPTNRPPVPVPGGPYSGQVDTAIAFDGSGSSDPDGDALTFSWNFGDGSAAAAGAQVSHRYQTDGTFTAILTVTDARGESRSANVAVTVSPASTNRPPVPVPGGPYSGQVGRAIAFDGSGSSDPDGDALTFSWNFGDNTTPAAGAQVTHAYQSEGAFTAVLTVTDARGESRSANVAVTVTPASTNRPPVPVAGGPYGGEAGRPIAFDGSGSTDPDGDALTFSWNFGDSSAPAAGARVEHMYQAAGSFTATLTVTDTQGESRTATAVVTVSAAPPDETAPFVTLNAPSQALPGSQVTVTALATDNVGVARVRFTLNGADPTDDDTAPYERQLTIPADAAAGTTFVVRAVASDLAGNTGAAEATITVAALPDTTNPTVALNAPPHAAPSAVVQLSATATDNVGVASVTFLAAGQPIATITQPPYQTTYTIPANAVVGSTIAIIARATDLSGHTAEDTADVTIVETPDTTPPTVELSAPAQIGAGRTLLVSAIAADNAGVASVQFFVDDVLVATDTQAPYDASFPVPEAAVSGTVLRVRARAVDYAGLEAVDTGNVAVLANRPPVANAGGPYTVQVGDLLRLTGAASSDPDGDALTYAWSFGDNQAAGTGPSPSHAYAAAGSFTVTLTVSDGRGGSAEATASVTVTPVADRAAPAITLVGPSRVLPGTTVTITAQVTDNIGVSDVAFTINGADPATTTTAPFTRVITVPAVAAPGTTLVVQGTAKDAAGNAASASITLTITPSPDTQAPVVSLRLPERTAAGATLIVGANATDDSGVRAVTFFAGSTPIGSDDTAPFEAVWTVPAGTAAGTLLSFTARATDFSDNLGEATGTVTVADSGDTTPPTVTLTAPPTVAAGGTLHLVATAQDEGGVASVEFYLDGVRIAVDAVSPYQVDYALPAGRLPGALLRLQARAIDHAGLEATAVGESRVTAAGQGVISGEVYDAATGLPLAGASVALIGKDARGQNYTATATSDARGRYLIRAEEGEGRLRITKANWTTVLRAARVTTGRAVQPIDARLTPLTPAVTVQPVVGGLIAQDGHEVTLPGGAIAGATALQLTPVGPQALQALLPGGWSPLAGIDLAPHGLAFGMPVAVTVPQVRPLAIGTDVLLARWDEQTSTWRAVAIVPITGDGRTLAGEIQATGQYVWLLPDTLPLAPVMPAATLEVEGLEIAPLPDAATTVINPQPRVLFYQPGVRAIVGGIVSHAQPLSSGVVLRTRVSEEYTFFSGAEARPEPYAADIVFYQTDAAGKTLGATYPATPSLPFEALSLQEGVIGVELYAPSAQDTELPLIGSEGGSATSSTGERLDLPPGATADPAPFRVDRLPPAQLGMTLPSGVTFAGGVSLDFTGDLAAAGTISVPRPADLPAGSRVLFARLEAIGGESRFLLVGVGRIEGDRLVSDVVVPGAPVTLDGVRRAGRYVFLRIGNPVAFFTGLVTGVTDAPQAGALITSSRLPAIVSRSAADGRYLAAVLTGASTLTARDLAKNDTGTAEGTVNDAWSVASLALRLVAQRPSVTSISPGANADEVPLSTPIVVRFSEPIDPASLAGAGGPRIVLSGPGGPVTASVTLSGNDTTVKLRPLTALAPDAHYTIAINQAIADLSGYTLAASVSSAFDTIDTAAPPPPPAGAITARIPVNGRTTVSATQGTAGPRDRVLIVNKRTGAVTPAVVNPDGSFSATVDAGLGDTLEIRIIDLAGNETVVAVGRFRDPDGRVAIGVEGGAIDAPNGLRLTISPGTFPVGATVKFTPLAPAAVNPTVPVGDDYPLVAGFEIDASVSPHRYMNVSFPAPSGTTSSSTGIVAKVVQVYGQQALSIVDTAKIIDGRIATSSPPCEGLVNKFGRYAMYLNEQEQMKLGIALLSMTVPRRQPVVLAPYTVTNPFLPYPPTILHPGMQFETLYNPATPFIRYIENTGDVEGGLDRADNATPVCFPVPADTQMRVVVRDAQTGALIQSVAQTTPPAGQIATITSIYVAPGDTQPPTVLWSSWSPRAPYILDSGKAIQLLFSEPVVLGAAPGEDAAYIVNQLTGMKIAVTGHLSDGNRGVTFVPQGALPIGTEFILRMPGLRDLNGNGFDQTLTFRTFEPTLVIPASTPAGPINYNRSRVLNDLTFAGITVPSSLQSVALNDIDFVTRAPSETPDGKWRTTLFGIGNSREFGFQILSIDASQPREPQAIGMLMGGQRFYNQMKVIRDIRLKFRSLPPGDPREQPIAAWRARELHYLVENPAERLCAAPGDPAIAAWRARQAPTASFAMKSGGCGTLGLATSFNTYYAILHLYDLTNAASPRLMGQRLLADGGSIAGYPRKNEAPSAQGPAARGVDLLEGVDFTHVIADTSRVHEDATAGFVAVFGSGITAVDLGENVPDIELNERPRDGTLIESLQHWSFPYYQDLTMLRHNVVAVARDQWDGTGTAHLEVFNAGLQPIGNPLPLPVQPYSMITVPGLLQWDEDGNGTPEDHDFAIVTGKQGVALVEVKAAGTAELVGFVPMPNAPRADQGLEVSNITGSCPALTFKVGDMLTVRTDAQTSYRRGACQNIVGGARVTVVTVPTSSGLRVTELAFLETPALIQVEMLRHVEVDKASRLAYVAGTWKKFDASYDGFVVLDVSNPYGGLTDKDNDGWDDRIRGFIPVAGLGLQTPSARLNGFRFDPQRKLIYAALDGEPDDASEANLAILRTCECGELEANVRLESGGAGTGPDRPSADGSTATIYVTPEMLASGQFRAKFDIDSYSGGEIHYSITEFSSTGLEEDKLLDLSSGATGTLSGGAQQILLALRRVGASPRGSVIAIDFTDAEGNFLKRAILHLVPTNVTSGDVKVRTFIDRTNGELYETPAYLVFALNHEAKVTIRVDGQIITPPSDGTTPGTPFQDVPLPAGLNQVLITRPMVSTPGEHQYEIRAEYEEGVQMVQAGKAIHEVVISESLPVGHTFIKGVDLSDGHLTLAREDITLATTGPALQFSRTYSSIGNNSGSTMGAGWSHNFQSHLTVDKQGRISIAGGEGSGVRFSQSEADPTFPGARVYKPQAGYHGRLVSAQGAYDYYTKARTRYHYELAPNQQGDPVYRLTFIEDSNTNRMTLAYAGELLRTVTDASGRTLTFTHERKANEQRLTKIDGPMALEVTFDYDELGNLTTATRGERVERYAYTIDQPRDRHNLARATDPNGHHTDYTYFAQADPFPGESPTFEWGRDILKVPMKYELVKRVTEGAETPEAAVTTFTFDYSQFATRYVTTVKDATDADTRYTMNPRGSVNEVRVLAQGGGADNVTTMRWAFEDGENDVTLKRKVDANGRVTRFEYDANANMTREIIEASVNGYAPVADASGTVATEVVTAWEYDATFNKLLKKTDAEGHVTEYEIDPANGNVLSMTADPGNNVPKAVTRYGYGTAPTTQSGTLRGLLKTITDPRENVTTYSQYDERGNPTQIQSAEGHVTTQVFDERGRMTDVSDSMGHHVATEYDALDRVEKQTKFAVHQPEEPSMASPDQVTTTTYFPGGQKKLVTDGLGHETAFTYDGLNRTRTKIDRTVDADGNGVELTMAWTYDGNGNRRVETDRRGIERHFTFDHLNRQRKVEVRENGTLKTLSAQDYDAAGNIVADVDLHGHRTRYELDALYRRVKVLLPLEPYVITMTYDLTGHELSSSDPNGRATRQTYDGLYRLLSRTDAAGNSTQFAYDAASNLLTETQTRTGLVKRHGPYDRVNRLLGSAVEFTDPLTGQAVTHTTSTQFLDAEHAVVSTNPRGFTLKERFNGFDRSIERIVDPNGLKLTTTRRYDENGNEAAVRDSEGTEPDAVRTFDGLNRKLRTEYPLGGVEKTFYDGSGNVVRTVDRRGIEMRHEYDALDRRTADILVESISNGGAEQTMAAIAYDDAQARTTTTNANGQATVAEFDALHHEVRTTDALSQVTTVQWDGVNQRRVTGPSGKHREMDYDALNRLTAVREYGTGETPLSTMATEYRDGELRQVDTDRRGAQRILQFDAVKRLRRMSRRHADLATPYGAAEVVMDESRYDGNGNVVASVDANGRVTEYTYDAADRRLTMTEGAGTPAAGTTTFTYDRAGSLLTVKDGRVHGGEADLRHTYDERNRRLTQTNGEGHVTTYTYDQNNEVETVTEPLGAAAVTRYAYDELGKLLSVDETRGGLGGVTRYRYDANRNKVAQQDANGNLTTYAYDALNRLTDSYEHTTAGAIAESTPRGGSLGGDQATALHWHYEYDADGNERLLVDAEGQRVTKAYDHLNRLVRKDYAQHKPAADGSVIYPQITSVVSILDGNGNATRVEELKQTDASNTVTQVSVMAYDLLNRLTGKTNPDGKALAYTYDRQGNRLSVTDPDSVTTSYSYDERNRVATATTEGGRVTRYAYWPDSLPRSTTSPNGVVSETTYDKADRIARVLSHGGDPAAPIAQYDYQYDANGNRLTTTERHRQMDGGAAQQTTYAYDALNRLSGVQYPGGASMAYTLMPNGNRLTEVGTDPATQAAVDREFAYNHVNQLTRIRNRADAAASVTFAYDRNGNTREQRTGQLTGEVIAAPTAVKRFDFDVRDKLRAVVAGADRTTFDYDYTGLRSRRGGASEAGFLYDEGALLQEYDASTRTTNLKYNYGAGLLSLVAVGSSRQSYFYTFDGQRSTAALTDDAGAVQAGYAYDAFGGLRRAAENTPNRVRYTGQYDDTETGLQYFGARYYDPSIGRFLSQDPFGGAEDAPPSLHKYAYAHGNPLTYGDPTGYAAESFSETASDLAAWGKGLATGVLKGVGAPVADLLESGVKGLSDITMVGVGILAMEASGHKYDDEIGALLTPESRMGKLSAEKGTITAIKESATGFVKETVKGAVTLPQRVLAASASGDPELLGMTLLEAGQMAHSMKAPLTKLSRPAIELLDRAIATEEFLWRERVSKRGLGSDTKVVTGTMTVQDAWQLAKACVGPGISGCAVVGGLQKPSFGNLVRNVFSGETLARGDKVVDFGSDKYIKYQGDIDFLQHRKNTPVYRDPALANQLNEAMSAPTLDTFKQHGVLGEFLPDSLTPDTVKLQWWMQEGLPIGSPIRAFDYWKKGVVMPDFVKMVDANGRRLTPKGPQAFLAKPGKAGVVMRGLEYDAFELRSRAFLLEDGPSFPTIPQGITQSINTNGLQNEYEKRRAK